MDGAKPRRIRIPALLVSGFTGETATVVVCAWRGSRDFRDDATGNVGDAAQRDQRWQ